jgi:membrane-bound lytic murein transglycosylase B
MPVTCPLRGPCHDLRVTHLQRARFAVFFGLVLALVGAGGYAVHFLTRSPERGLLTVDGVGAPPTDRSPKSAEPRTDSSTAAPAVSPTWVARTATRSGIPAPAVRAFGTATLRSNDEDPACHLGWTTLAGIGWIESHHGTIDGRRLRTNGRPDRPITGVSLDGSGDVAAVPDGSGGFQRAMGPMQFIPSTWKSWSSDGDGDGVADPQDVDDAAYAAARYLCASGGDLATGPGWTAAVLSYNHSGDYVRDVYDAARDYAARTS